MGYNPRVRSVVTVGCMLLGCASRLWAVDPQRLLLVARAEADFDRLEQAAGQEVPDAARCQQSEAALLSVALPQEIAVIHFRKGYCTLASAIVTRRAEDFLEAADEFEKAIQSWPERAASSHSKQSRPDPVPSSLRVLRSIARLEAGLGAPGIDRAQLDHARNDLTSAIDLPVCSARLLPDSACPALLATGSLWLGWIDLRQEDLYRANLHFSGPRDSAWGHWAAGKQAFHDRQYREAATQYRQAADAWMQAQIEPAGPLLARLSPPPDWAQALAEWGGAQLLSGDFGAAIATLDRAVKDSTNPARALYLRARAKELSGRMDEALADYSLASRAALASANDLASGEAHLYRGILLYRRKDPAQAESEFASALNFDIPDALRPDAIAWRYLAGVAGGGCGSSRALLEQSLASVSPYFPKVEARAAAVGCPLSTSGI